MDWIHPKYQHSLLFEYYDRVSNEGDNDLLDNWEVWIYGNDRSEFPPHCHVRLPDGSAEFEVSLLNWEVVNIKYNDLPNSWGSIDRNLKKGFFEWLQRKSVAMPLLTNKLHLYDFWDGANPNNLLEKWANKDSTIDKDLMEYLHINTQIDAEELIKSIFNIVLPLYQSDSKACEELHNIALNDAIQFAVQVGLPFEFTEYNSTAKVQRIISDYEKMCYNIAIQSDK